MATTLGGTGNRTIAVVANRHDRLARAVAGMLRAERCAVAWIDEDTLPSAPFALRALGATIHCRVHASGTPLSLAEAHALFLRPVLPWPADVDFRHRAFVEHETLATWFAAFGALPGRVLNRWPLEFWLGDPNWCDSLLSGLGNALDLPTGTSSGRGDAWESVLVGPTLLSRRGGPADALTRRLRERSAQVRQWQERTGVSLCTIQASGEAPGTPTLRGIDPFPSATEPSVIREITQWLR